ncbi:hypothetical protein CHLRE_14g610801v5 [Chlamydomonas reinhardtii]|uniref:Uncharacterized protein n=1 Tax=Chlamydomonas reinhardtii TaxID=3055 RepID=A0A2K3CXA3_CHLRE|nr:uncharacterized protein CHLRE_14g610801v5 [Chlamydomonas reinhardtii]PNW72898.1 hypothetical protein CHLRE_14g610801v5 [Chlamydomonas reinhardtii]
MYVAACVGAIAANANAVVVASFTYSLSSVIPERRFIEWLARKTQNSVGRNISMWVQCGLVAMLLCIVLAAALLHGWVMGIVAGGVALVLFTTGQVANLLILRTFIAMTDEDQSNKKEAVRSWKDTFSIIAASLTSQPLPPRSDQ